MKTALYCFRVLVALSIASLACWLSGVTLTPRSLLLVAAFAGLALAVWANRLNPEGGKVGPLPIPANPVRRGPYRLFRHPMYVGQYTAIVCFMWYSAGFWAALAIAVFAEIFFREYVWREEGSQPQKDNLTCSPKTGPRIPFSNTESRNAQE